MCQYALCFRQNVVGRRNARQGRRRLQNNIEEPSRPEAIMKENIGQWCIVKYDGEPYPGIILEVEEDVRVKCMHKNGINKFYWPGPREDISWYRDDQIVCLMKEPQPLNKRSVQLEKEVWKFLENLGCWSDK